MLVRFHIFLITRRSSSFAASMLPSNKQDKKLKCPQNSRVENEARCHLTTCDIAMVGASPHRRGNVMDVVPACTLDLPETSTTRGQVRPLTFNLDSQGRPDERKQRRVEHDGAVTVQRHVHGDESLQHRHRAHTEPDSSH